MIAGAPLTWRELIDLRAHGEQVVEVLDGGVVEVKSGWHVSYANQYVVTC